MNTAESSGGVAVKPRDFACPQGGLVRGSRRPPGWAPPGPVPPGPGQDDDLWPATGEDLCFLTGEWRIFQRLNGHRYSLDDMVTAWYAIQAVQGREVRRAADIGCGIGSVLMMVAWALPEVPMVGVEAQELSMGLARRSLRYNGAASRVEVRWGDLRDPAMLPEGRVFDLVTGTPPYIPPGDGVMSEKEQCAPCRFELRGGVEDYCATAARVLAPQGRFVVCHAAGQRQRVLDAGKLAGLSTLRFRDVIPRDGRNPLLAVFVMAHADEVTTPTVEEPPLKVRDPSGARTPEYLDIREAMGMPP
jgi:tRNA1Val (adenine37-N6)-methyltransferase